MIRIIAPQTNKPHGEESISIAPDGKIPCTARMADFWVFLVKATGNTASIAKFINTTLTQQAASTLEHNVWFGALQIIVGTGDGVLGDSSKTLLQKIKDTAARELHEYIDLNVIQFGRILTSNRRNLTRFFDFEIKESHNQNAYWIRQKPSTEIGDIASVSPPDLHHTESGSESLVVDFWGDGEITLKNKATNRERENESIKNIKEESPVMSPSPPLHAGPCSSGDSRRGEISGGAGDLPRSSTKSPQDNQPNFTNLKAQTMSKEVFDEI